MPVIFKHPRLTDYFVRVVDARADSPETTPSIIKPYEAGRIISFPELRFDIDFDYWASLPTEAYRGLKKLSSSPSARDPAKDPVLDRRLADARIPVDIERRLKREIRGIYEQVLPIYEALFSGYRFVRRQVVWRLNTIRNENLHIDTYATEFEEHFARLFINLDNQPRIWMTSFTTEELFQRFGAGLTREQLETMNAGQVRAALNSIVFGGRSNVWWDRQPRHMIYFDPGDVWAVDSRQVSHQIFYGRRAVSIDFFVDKASMRKPKRHYLHMAEIERQKLLWPRMTAPAAAAAE